MGDGNKMVEKRGRIIKEKEGRRGGLHLSPSSCIPAFGADYHDSLAALLTSNMQYVGGGVYSAPSHTPQEPHPASVLTFGRCPTATFP